LKGYDFFGGGQREGGVGWGVPYVPPQKHSIHFGVDILLVVSYYAISDTILPLFGFIIAAELVLKFCLCHKRQ